MSVRNSSPNVDYHEVTQESHQEADSPRRSGTLPTMGSSGPRHSGPHSPQHMINASPTSETLSFPNQKDFLKVNDFNGSASGGLHRLSNLERRKSASQMVQSEPRETWGKKADFLLSVIGFAVDLANVWRFPYLCYKNGGGAFLVPYILMLLFGGIPLFYMELALGQYIRKGAITCWGRVCPLFKGVGFTVVMIAFYTDFFYNVLIAMSLYYFFSSFAANLPWTYCGNSWNQATCYDEHLKDCNDIQNVNLSYCQRLLEELWANISSTTPELTTTVATLLDASNITSLYNTSVGPSRTYPADEFYKFAVLGRSNMTNLENIGNVQWHLSTCLLIVYIICYFSLWKGISMSGKVVWFTALFPYIVLFTLLIRGLTLDGAMTGIKYYITPNMSTLATAEPWVDAATQVFFSLGPGFGVLLAFASYNPFHNNVYKDALITSAVNSGTSFLSGFVVFSVLGYMAKKRNMEVRDVISDGDPNLVFTVYPEALATLPGSTFWSINFFLMLLTLGLDSSFGGSEAILTALGDEFPILKRRREVFLGFLLLFYYCVGLTEITQGGIYIFNLFERYCVTYSILIAVFIETFCVSWIYGVDRFRENIREMTGFMPGLYWKLCWKYIAPVFIMWNCVYGLVSHKDLELDGYVYPRWANNVGWALAMSSVMFIPLVGIYQIIRAPGNTFREKIRFVLTPFADHIHKEEMAIAASISMNAEMDRMLPDVRVEEVDDKSSTAPSSPPGYASPV